MTFGPYCFNNSKFEPEKLLKSFKITIKENKTNDVESIKENKTNKVECTTTKNSLQTDEMAITWNNNSNIRQKAMIIS